MYSLESVPACMLLSIVSAVESEGNVICSYALLEGTARARRFASS